MRLAEVETVRVLWMLYSCPHSEQIDPLRRHENNADGARPRVGRDDIGNGGDGQFGKSSPTAIRPAQMQGHQQPAMAIPQAGLNGAGHFIKMVHDGIEYEITAAYAKRPRVLREVRRGFSGQTPLGLAVRVRRTLRKVREMKP